MYEELFQTLHQDHEGVRETLRRLKAEESSSERTRLVFELEAEILPHMMAEEKVLYPRLKAEEGEVREDALESVAEHHAVRLVLRDLAETPTNDEAFPAKVRVLEEMVEHHVREEEGDIFQDVRERLADREAGDLLQRFREEKKNAPCGPAEGKGWWGG